MRESNQFITKMEYQKSLNQNYLVYKNERGEENYELRMLAENQIDHLLPVELRSIDGREDMYYKIGSLQPLSKLYKNREMKLEDVRIILIGLTGAIAAIQEYMLDERHVVLMPEYIFMRRESREVRLLFHPFYEEDIREGVREFADYLIGRIDHTEQQAVMMGYQFYRIVREDNFIIEDIVKLYRKEQGGAIGKDKEITQGKDFEINGDISKEVSNEISEDILQDASEDILKYVSDNISDNISKKISKTKYAKTDRYPTKNEHAVSSGYNEKSKFKSKDKDAESSEDKTETGLKKLLLFSILALTSGIFLCFGISPYRPDNMAKVILALIMLVSVSGICKEIMHLIRNRKDHDSEENKYDKIFSDNKKFIDNKKIINDIKFSNDNADDEIHNNAYDIKKLNNDTDDEKRLNYDTYDVKKLKYDAYFEKSSRNDIDDLNQQDDIEMELSQQNINADYGHGQKEESEIYGRTVLLSGDGKMAENILTEIRRGKEIVHQLEEFPYVIGKVKDSVNLVLNDVSVSRIHAKLTEENGQVYVQDCNSTNGTYVNGVLLEKEEKIPIEADDEIRIGRITLLYQ